MTKFPLQIALYDTREEGVARFHAALSHGIARAGKTDDIALLLVNGNDIRDGCLGEPDIAGLLMPGRNKGQTYRDELGMSGFAAIQDATKDGMAVAAICAASYVLSHEVYWQSDLEAKSTKNVFNETPLFNGRAVGPFNELWQYGYCYPVAQKSGSVSSLLIAQVANVDFHPDLHGGNLTQSGHAVYWGGGAFQPAQQASPVTSLASYSDPVELPAIGGRAGPRQMTDAVIQFKCGDGNVLFSNIHPEVTAPILVESFKEMPRARLSHRAFESDRQKLEASSPMHNAIFDRFIENSILGGELRMAKKPVAQAIPSL